MKLKLVGAVVAGLLLASPAWADFDVANFTGDMLSADQLKALAEAAAAKHPPKNGNHLVIGFANLSRNIPFTQFVEKSILDNAKAAGVEVVVGDNQLDGPTALSVAQSFGSRNLDGVIEFQLDVNFGAAIMKIFDDQSLPVIAIDIPMPGATFFGVNNPQSGFIGGTYLAEAAIAKFGEDKVKKQGYFIVGELAQSGAVLAMRSAGQRAGIKAVLGLPDDRMITIDTTATIEQAFSQTNSVLARIPPDAPIMVTANNDQSVIGMLRAIDAAGRSDNVVGVGMGADENETMVKTPNMVGSVAFFPERYGNWVVPMILAELGGQKLPDAVLIKHLVVNKTNVCKYYSYPCIDKDPYVTFDYKYPEDAFNKLLDDIRADKKYAGSLAVLPSK
jgi:ribose transport system substrate-binding protein